MRVLKHLLRASAAALTIASGHGAAVAAQPAAAEAAVRQLMPVEQFQLPNGLRVVFHIDRSDPVVAVALAAHVGSAREEPGRTGFAHMFEHLFFLDSENLGPGGLDALSSRIGGSGANGYTTRDLTVYLQTVPRDALEKMIWAEADKLGFFINTVSEEVLAKEKQVVKNEKRQSNDNQPYGHTDTVLVENLYPQDHPYSWPVIGSLRDLDAATLEDVRAFYRRWYTPNNVTLVVAGDFDPAQARAWVERYFGEFARGAEAPDMAPRPAALGATRLLFHEDNMAQLPQLTVAWPTVPAHHPDAHALNLLLDVLTDGKTTPLHAVLVEEERLTSAVGAGAYPGKVAGEMRLQVRAFDGVSLDRVKAALDAGFARFESQGVDVAALERAKTQREVAFYDRISSVLGKASAIATYAVHAGRPDFADEDVAALRAVSAADLRRVYETYIKDRPFVAASFVPRGKPELALAGSRRAEVYEEPIVQGAEADVAPVAATGYARTPSAFDRTVEPPYGEAPALNLPDIWQAALPNGLRLAGIEDHELPMARFEIAIDGGRLMDRLDRPGTGNLVAQMLKRGTRRLTAAQFEEALKSLGAEIDVGLEDEHFVVSGATLARNFEATIALVQEMLLTPRWDEDELALAKAAVTSAIQSRKVQPNAVAHRMFERVTFGENHIYARDPLGTEASVAALTMDELKRYHAANLAPNIARFRVVGAIGRDRVEAALAGLGRDWRSRDVAIPDWPAPQAPDRAQLFFYDIPGASQSVFAFGYPGPRRAAEDHYPANVMNYILGGGGFASRLMQQLREGKGYTYGIYSQFAGGVRHGRFQLMSGVRANVTLEAAQLTRSILADYAGSFSEADLDVTRSFLTRSRARAFETLDAKLDYLGQVTDYGLAADYPLREQGIVDRMSVAEVRDLARRYVRPDAMTYVVVGDAATQAERLKALGLGDPVILRSLD
ncbi:MAG: M16 family metallopeptidase [Allosphingosinicella sp.]|uniref:M16 family metallopeptidase n=1 Tax=Allosphingosinicella sp. TaxID=2823234 RepID=UPI003925D2C5